MLRHSRIQIVNCTLWQDSRSHIYRKNNAWNILIRTMRKVY